MSREPASGMHKPQSGAIRTEIDRLVKAEFFRPTQRRLLRFLVSAALEDRDLSEKEIAEEVFGQHGYRAEETSVVRTSVTRLRNALDKYYR